MKAALLGFVTTAGLTGIATAQMDPPELMWAREYFVTTGTGFKHVEVTSDDGYMIAGQSGASGTQRTIGFRMDQDGDVLWTYASDLYDQFSWWVEITSDGGYVLTGQGKWSYSDSYSVFLIKLDPDGQEEWIRLYDGSSGRDEGYCCTELPDGGYAVCGYVDNNDAWLIRTDSLGDTLWTRAWDSGGYDRARRVVYQDGGLTVFISANTPRLLRYSMDGNLLWVQSCPGFSGPGFPGSMCIGSDSGYVTMDTGGEWDGVMAHTDREGGIIWQYPIPGEWSRDGSSISRTMDGGYLVSGWNGYYPPIQDSNPETHDGWLVRFDSLGQYQWLISNEIVRDNYFNSARQLASGGYIVAGQIWNTSLSTWSGYLLRFAPETGIGGEENPEPVLQLHPSSNPFSSSVAITCEGEALPGQLMVYDITGRLIRSLSDRQGSSFTWDGRDASGAEVPAGAYLIQGAVDGQVSSIRVIRLN